MSDYLIARGWTPCTDETHKHGEAGKGTVLHPPGDTEGRTSAPTELMTYDEAIRRGLTGGDPR